MNYISNKIHTLDSHSEVHYPYEVQVIFAISITTKISKIKTKMNFKTSLV